MCRTGGEPPPRAATGPGHDAPPKGPALAGGLLDALVPPGGTDGAPGAARAPGGGAFEHLDAAAVDTDVPAAVGTALAEVLRDRLAEAARLDEAFAEDLATRTARFTAGGKRMRSGFLWWGLRACTAPDAAGTRTALRVAAGLELLQTCALVHDDVMDDSPLRRGAPALHVALADRYAGAVPRPRAAALGRAAAVLAGDLALAWADDTVAEALAGPDLAPGVPAAVGAVWRAMRTEMVAGQYLDLHGQVAGERTPARALRTAYLKSASYSVERPLALGAALAGADERTTRELCAAGSAAGIAFQLRDDLAGVFGDPAHTGKRAGEDVRAGKATSLVATARALAREQGRQDTLAVLDRRLGDPDLSDTELDRVREVLARGGARDAVESAVADLVARSLAALDRADVDARARERLRAMVHAAAGTAGPAAAGGAGPR
ncbi:polyprenyl synthetase family protein [Streptomyces sp. NPDC059740]|uniref:polyprenyl synthetase family protein n=1 Tax=Streptomyces sp. NPDC059740 TaxID=3346926 RepID=UPI00365DF3D7